MLYKFVYVLSNKNMAQTMDICRSCDTHCPIHQIVGPEIYSPEDMRDQLVIYFAAIMDIKGLL